MLYSFKIFLNLFHFLSHNKSLDIALYYNSVLSALSSSSSCKDFLIPFLNFNTVFSYFGQQLFEQSCFPNSMKLTDFLSALNNFLNFIQKTLSLLILNPLSLKSFCILMLLPHLFLIFFNFSFFKNKIIIKKK